MSKGRLKRRQSSPPPDNRWLVRCLDARYDEDDEMLVLNCEFDGYGFRRLLCFARKDFTFKGDPNVPHEEMRKTAELFKGKPFWFVMNDDPVREKITPENQAKYVQYFTDEMGKYMNSVADGLADSDRRVARRVADIVEKDRARKRDASDILAEEMAIRASLGSIARDK
jgi:hypothetical protein